MSYITYQKIFKKGFYLSRRELSRTLSSNTKFIYKSYESSNIWKRHNSQININTNSWASERLQEKGEKLEKVSATVQVLTDETLVAPSEKVKKLSDEILALNMVEVNQLLKALTVRLGISDDEINVHSYGRGGGGGGGGGGSNQAAATATVVAAAEPVKEKEAFDLKLISFDAKSKIKVIKEVRTVTNLGLKEAKDLVEKVPAMLKQGLKKEEAEAFKKILTDAGAVVELL